MSQSSADKQKSVLYSFAAGSLSGTCAIILFQPLDLVKTRLQEPVALAQGRPAGIISTIGSVVRNDSVLGLWKGFTPSLVRCVPGVGLYFSFVHALTAQLRHKPSAVQSMLIGLSARSFVCTVMLPITVVKTRFESQQFGYQSVRGALHDIWRVEGVRGLFSGLSATLVRDAPFSGLYLMLYRQLKDHVPQADYPQIDVATKHFLCGLVAGALASTVTQPADVIKTSMQVQSQYFRSPFKAVAFIWQQQGLSGFFRGLTPRAARRTLVSAMAWTLYEQAMVPGRKH